VFCIVLHVTDVSDVGIVFEESSLETGPTGLRITFADPEGLGYECGLRVNDIVLRMNNLSISRVWNAWRLMEAASKHRATVLCTIRRAPKARTKLWKCCFPPHA
jgi:hypothetical protein